MRAKEIKGRFVQKHDIEANWKLAVNFSPLLGEIIIYDADENCAYDRIKIGDGVTNVNELPFIQLDVNFLQQEEDDVLILGGGPASQIGVPQTPDNVIIVSSETQENILTIKDKMYIIKYDNIPYYDGEGNALTNKQPLYITKIGDGIHNLSEISPLQNLVAGNEGEGSMIQFLESELYEIAGSGDNTTRSTAIGKGSFAGGRYNKVVGRESAAFNYNNIVLGEKSFAVGQSNIINKETQNNPKEKIEGSFAAGLANEVNGTFQTVIGTYCSSGYNDAFVVGNGYKDKIKDRIVRQNAFKVDKQGNTEIRGSLEAKYTKVQGLHNMYGPSYLGNAMISSMSDFEGDNSKANGSGSAAFNLRNTVDGKNSFAALTGNTIPAKTADGQYDIESVFIAGHANIAAGSHQAIFGVYSNPKENDAFVVGNGNSTTRKNAFVVNKNGNVFIGGTEIDLSGTKITKDSFLPKVTTKDNGKVLMVVDGEWHYATIDNLPSFDVNINNIYQEEEDYIILTGLTTKGGNS